MVCPMSAIGSCGIINMVSKHLSGVLDMLKGLIALLHSDIDSIGWRPSLKKQPAADNLCNDFFSNQVRTVALDVSNCELPSEPSGQRLNGRTGHIVCRQTQTRRFGVKLEGEDDKSIKPENLIPITSEVDCQLMWFQASGYMC